MDKIRPSHYYQLPKDSFLSGPKNLLRTVLHSKPKEYKVWKAIGGALCGFTLFLYFYNVFLKQVDVPDYMLYTLAVIFFNFLTVGCAISVQVRCTALLTVPAFFTKYCRSMMMSLAILYLVSGPIANLGKNMAEASRAISCARALSLNVSNAEMELTFKPIKQALTAMQGASPSFQNENEKSADTFDPTEYESYDEDTKVQDESATEEAGKYDVDIEKNRKEIEQGKAGLKKLEGNLRIKTDYRCMTFFNEIDKQCRKKVDYMNKKCRSYFFLRLFGICKFFDKLRKKCIISQLMPGASACEAKKVLKGLQEVYDMAVKTTNLLRESFRPAHMQFKIKQYAEALMENTPEELSYKLKESVEKRVRFLNDLISLLKIIVTFLFVMIFFKAFKIQAKYLKNLEFHNTILTDYFFRIENRRRLQGKPVLLPLRRIEMRAVHTSTSLKITKLEMGKMRMGIIKTSVVIVMFVGVVFIDMFLAACMRIVNKHSRTATILVGHHIIKVETVGQSKVAELMKELVGSFTVSHSINEVFSNDHCLPNPHPQYATDLADMFGTLVLLLASHVGEAYAQRLLIAICAFFYPKQQKKRILHLYNGLLKKRKGFAKYARKMIRKKAYQNKLIDMDTQKWEIFFMKFPITEKFLGKLPCAQRKCVMCDEVPKGIKIKCQTPFCFQVYCQTCWQDVDGLCLACQDQEDWTTDSEGYSLESE